MHLPYKLLVWLKGNPKPKHESECPKDLQKTCSWAMGQFLIDTLSSASTKLVECKLKFPCAFFDVVSPGSPASLDLQEPPCLFPGRLLAAPQ